MSSIAHLAQDLHVIPAIAAATESDLTLLGAFVPSFVIPRLGDVFFKIAG
jgi:hypothetical protein